MPSFSFALEQWNDHGVVGLACVGREVGGDAVVVRLHRYWETGGYLYGYWCQGLFAKIFVDQDPEDREGRRWKAKIGDLVNEADPSQRPSLSRRESAAARIVDALRQWPESDLRFVVPGALLREVDLRKP
jgi:hypothetical protein